MRSYLPFGDLWEMPIEVPYSMLVRDGDLAWTCGQVPLDDKSQVVAPHDLLGQTEEVCGNVQEIFRRRSIPIEDVGQVILYYVPTPGGKADVAEMLARCRVRFGEVPLLVPVPVPYFYYDGLLLEVDIFTGKSTGQTVRAAVGDTRVALADGGELLWACVQTTAEGLDGAVGLLEQSLARVGLSRENRLCDHWVVSLPPTGGGELTTTADLLVDLGVMSDGGALIAGNQDEDQIVGWLTFVKGGRTECLEPMGKAANVRLTFRRNGRFAWVCGRSCDGDNGLVDQTTQVMAAIAEAFDGTANTFQHVVKSTCHYVGSSSAEDLHDNMAVRNGYYTKPGPASTGLPVFGLADNRSKTVIDLMMIEPLADCGKN